MTIETIWLALVAVLAAAFQGAVGFGGALVATPLLLAFLPQGEAVPLAIVLSTVGALALLPSVRRAVVASAATRLTLGAALGIPLGMAVLAIAPLSWLRAAIATVIALTLLQRPAPVAGSPRGAHAGHLAAGFGAGALAAALGTPGPPLYWSLERSGHGKDQVRATLLMTLVSIYAVTLFGYVLRGGFEQLPLISLATVAAGAAVGGFVGHAASGLLGEASYRRIARLVLAATALSLIWQILR